jgi:hypothetical protein
MEKILIKVNGIIHTFESIKETAKHKIEFFEQMESLLNESPIQRVYSHILLKDMFIENPNEFYKKYMEGQPIIEIEEFLIDLCIVGIDIDEYFVCENQDKQKRGFCGIANYKNLCETIGEDKDIFCEDGYDEGGYDTLGEMLNFHSSTKKGCKKKDIVKRRKKNKNKKTHR